MSQDQDGISLPVPCFGACPGKESLVGESSRSRSGGGGGSGGASGIPAAGTFWQDSMVGSGGFSPTERSPMDGGGLLSTGKSSKSRSVTVAYVVNGEASLQNNAESMALQCLKDACDTVGSRLETVNFGKLDFGETTVLDRFYNAGESSEGMFQNPIPKLPNLHPHAVDRRLGMILTLYRLNCEQQILVGVSALVHDGSAQENLYFLLISPAGSKVTPLLPRLCSWKQFSCRAGCSGLPEHNTSLSMSGLEPATFMSG